MKALIKFMANGQGERIELSTIIKARGQDELDRKCSKAIKWLEDNTQFKVYDKKFKVPHINDYYVYSQDCNEPIINEFDNKYTSVIGKTINLKLKYEFVKHF